MFWVLGVIGSSRGRARWRAAGWSRPGRCRRVDPISVVREHVAHMAVLERAQRERAFAGRFQPGVAVAFGQPEQPQAGAVAVLGVLVVRKQPRDDFAGGGVNGDLAGDEEQAGGQDRLVVRPYRVGSLAGVDDLFHVNTVS